MMLFFQSSVDKPPVDFKKKGAYLKSKHITHHVCHRTWNTERNSNKLKIALECNVQWLKFFFPCMGSLYLVVLLNLSILGSIRYN